jgi:drug/metabolite transporter (DMT)-like permease
MCRQAFLCSPSSPLKLFGFMSNKRLRADLGLLLCALIWGATFVVVKDALADVSVAVYIAVRFALSAAVMGILFRRSLRGLDRKAIWAGAQIGVFLLGGYAFQTTGLKFTTPSKAAFITGSSVVLVPVLLAVFGRRRLNWWIWAGALAAFAGLYYLTVPPEGLAALNIGDPIVLAGAIMFALHIIFISRHVGEHSSGALSFLQVATTAVLATAALPLLAITRVEHPRWVWSGNLIAAVLITALGSTVIGFSLQTWAQKYTSPSHTAIFISLEPVFAVLTSWLFAREQIGRRIIVGGALILAGILIAELKAPSPTVPESPDPVVRRAG